MSWEPQLMQNCTSFIAVGFLFLHPEMKPQRKLTAIAPNKMATRYSTEATIPTHPSDSFNNLSSYRAFSWYSLDGSIIHSSMMVLATPIAVKMKIAYVRTWLT